MTSCEIGYGNTPSVTGVTLNIDGAELLSQVGTTGNVPASPSTFRTCVDPEMLWNVTENERSAPHQFVNAHEMESADFSSAAGEEGWETAGTTPTSLPAD